MEFIGRTEELAFLEDQYRSEHPFVLIMGRRRVGKSELIHEFLKGKNALYYEVDRQISNATLSSFSDAVSKIVGYRIGRYTEWIDAFKAYVELAPPGKKVIAIDEFQYLSMSDVNFTKTFQSIWDNYLSKQDVMVIICGSYLNMMRQIATDYGGPLFGRNTGDLMLMPLKFRETFHGQNYKRAVEEYAFTGGVPYYMEQMRDNRTVINNIMRLTMEPGAAFLNEPEYLMTGDLTDPVYYNAYLSTVANGNHRMDKISSALEAPASKILPYMRRLMNVGMISKRVPVTEKDPDHSRFGLYTVSDNFTAFWYRFVKPFYSSILRGIPDEAIANLKDHYIDSHVAFVFEDISLFELHRYLLSKGVAAKYGSYWDRNTEIDVVALDRRNKVAYVGECKYHKEPVGESVLNDLMKKSATVHDFKFMDVVPCLFSVSGYTKGTVRVAESIGAILFDCGEPVTSRSSSS